MTIDWVHFTPWTALAGGLLLGVAVAAFLLLNGRVLGVSGIIGGLWAPVSGDRLWRVLFIAGMLVAPWAVTLVAPMATPRIEAGWAVLVAAGLLVGWGTSMGSGCTSGHGVCGISRLSPRSLVATLVFMCAGMAVVFVVRHLLR
jgi:uncharacterized membrane protein YedE/YeeE